VACKNKALILDRIAIPQFSSLAIERARAGRKSASIPHAIYQQKNALIRLAQQALQTQQHGVDIVYSTPLLLQDIQADATAEIDIGMVDGRLEEHGRRRIRVVVCEFHG
jgi:hypothetical protein